MGTRTPDIYKQIGHKIRELRTSVKGKVILDGIRSEWRTQCEEDTAFVAAVAAMAALTSYSCMVLRQDKKKWRTEVRHEKKQ